MAKILPLMFMCSFFHFHIPSMFPFFILLFPCSISSIHHINMLPHSHVSIPMFPFLHAHVPMFPSQEMEVNGIKFWAYNAGHVLGAAMFMIEIAGVKVLYTGDFSRSEDRHLMAAEIPSISPDVLITVSHCTIVHHQLEHFSFI